MGNGVVYKMPCATTSIRIAGISALPSLGSGRGGQAVDIGCKAFARSGSLCGWPTGFCTAQVLEGARAKQTSLALFPTFPVDFCQSGEHGVVPAWGLELGGWGTRGFGGSTPHAA